MYRIKWLAVALVVFLATLAVVIAGRELLSASSAPTGVAKNSRLRAIEISESLAEVRVVNILELPRFNDRSYGMRDEFGNTARVIVADLEKAAADWHKCQVGDLVKFEVREFPVILPGEDPSLRESLAWFLKPTCTGESAPH